MNANIFKRAASKSIALSAQRLNCLPQNTILNLFKCAFLIFMEVGGV